jgi:hypothetical protein
MTTRTSLFVAANTFAIVTTPAGKRVDEYRTKKDLYFSEGRRKNGWFKFVGEKGFILEVAAAFVKKVQVEDPEACDACEGTGIYDSHGSSTMNDGGPCYRCKGKGFQNADDKKRNAAWQAFAAKREKELTQEQCNQLDNAYAAYCAEQDEEPDRSDYEADNADLIARDHARHASRV